MKSYPCTKCNKIFKQKSHYTNHINRQIKCDEIIIYKCNHCSKTFANASNRNKHIDNNCKIKKLETERDNKLQIIFDKLNNLLDQLKQ